MNGRFPVSLMINTK